MTLHPWSALNNYHQLPIAVLETYLRPGCLCVVCSEAKAQIAQRKKEATC